MSQSKLQFIKPEVKVLGHLIGRRYKKLSLERISGVLSIGAPKTKRGGRLWIEQNPERVKFLYEKLVSPDPIHRTSKDEKQLQSLKIKLSRALVLSLPNLNKDFELFVSTEGGAAIWGVNPRIGKLQETCDVSIKAPRPGSKRVACVLTGHSCYCCLIGTGPGSNIGRIKVHTPHGLRTVLSQ